MTATSDYDQTTGPGLPCPVAPACEGCADVAGPRDVYEADTPAGVMCLTLCPACVGAAELPRLTFPEALRRTLEHCEHTGRDLDGNDIDLEALASGWGSCARCGQRFPERDDRPYCAACEDGPDDAHGEVSW